MTTRTMRRSLLSGLLLSTLLFAARPALAQRGDPSLTVAAYRSMGFPDPGQRWTAADYPTLTPLLEQLAHRTPATLPRYQSRRSGAMFARMTDRAPLQALRRDDEALATRFEQANQILGTLSQWLTSYNGAPRADGTWDDELVELFGRLIESADLVLGLLDELRAQQAPEQRDNPQAREGYAQVQRGIAQMVGGMLSTFVPPDRPLFSTPSLERLSGYLIATLPALMPHLTDELRADLRQKADQALAHNRGNATLNVALTRLRAAAH